MEKFSLYEFLSFIAPGCLCIFLVNLYSRQIIGFEVFKNVADINLFESVLYIIASLAIGIGVHRMTFFLLKYKWYKKLVYKPVPDMVLNNNELKPLLPFLEDNYRQLHSGKREKVSQDEIYDEIFDTAYYFLEVNDKISQVKSFQSLYFFFRNILTLLMLLFVPALFLSIGGACIFPSFHTACSVWFLGTGLFILLILIEPTRWLREKMTVRLFRSYYTCMIHKGNPLKS